MRLSERSVHAGVRASLRRSISFVAVVLFLTLLASVALAPLGERAAAASVRIASIVSVSGTVEVKKSGGKKYFKAYKDMPLNAGDHLKTGDKSTVTIRVQDRADEATLGGGSSLYISELRDASGKKKSNFTLWTGSMWVKASTLVSTEDEFEVETPTAVMGVRGTNLLVTVDSLTGESMFMIASGVGQVFSKNTGKKDDAPSTIYPSQMLNTYFDEQKRSEKDEVVFVNLEQLVQNAGPGVIEAIIRNKAAIDKENSELLERLRRELDPSAGLDPEQEDGLDIKSIDDLERLQRNLERFVANTVNEAIKQEKVDADTIRKLVEEANRSLDNKIDLINTKEPELTDKEKEKQRLAEQAKQERDRLKRQKEQALADQQKRQQELLDKVAEQARQIQEASQRAMEEQKRKAEEEYLKKLEESKLKAFQEAKKKLEQAAGTPTPTSAATPVSTPTATPTATPPSLNQPGTITGSLEQTVSGSSDVYYGPASDTVTITGNLTITGGQTATGVYTLRNMTIGGNLTVTVPHGSVVLLDSVTVQGATTIVDVAANTFGSSAAHEEAIEVKDSNGARVVLQGNAASGTVRITGSGEIVLEGSYDGEVIIEGDATSIVLKGQFTGTVQVNVPNVAMTVDSAALFTGALEINANGFSLVDTSNKVGNIVPGSDVEVNPNILDNAKLIRLNQAKNVEAVLAFLYESEYAGAYLWHAEQLLARRNNQQGGSGFESWALASAAIAEVLELKEPGPTLETEGEPYADDLSVTFVFDGEDPDYQEWIERVIEVHIYKGSTTEGELLRTIAVNAEEGEDADLATLEEGRLELDGSIFATAGAGSYTLRLTADVRFDDVIHTFVLSPTNWLSGDMDLNDMPVVAQTIIGTEDRAYGPLSGTLKVRGTLILSGEGSGTYTLGNLFIEGDLIIDLPYGSVVLLDSVTVAGTTYIEGISGGFAPEGGAQPLVAVTEPTEVPSGPLGNGFDSTAQHESNIELLDSDGATVRLAFPASSAGLTISGGGHVLLHGLYNEDVFVAANAAAVALRIAPDAKVMAQLHIDAADVLLNLQGVLLDIGLGQPVEATASVQAVRQQIEQYKQDIIAAWQDFNHMEGDDLSEFKQALEAAGFELDRTTYLYLLNSHIYAGEGTNLYSLLDIRDWLKEWSELTPIQPDFEQGAVLTIEDTPYGQPLRLTYSGFTPILGNEGQGEWLEGYEPFEWPDWFEQASGVTIRQEHGDEVIERYYPLNFSLPCIIEWPEECQPDWDMTIFHPGEAVATIHGGLRYEMEEEEGYNEEVTGLYDDIANLSFIIGQPDDLAWERYGTLTHFVYGDENKVFGSANPEQPAVIDTLSIRGSGSGTYTLQNVVINRELIVDIPNGSLVLGVNVHFESMEAEGTPWITIRDVNSVANGGLVINGLVDKIDIYVDDSNEARLSLQTLPTVDKPFVSVSGPGTVELAGAYGYVEVENYVEGQGHEGMPLSDRVVKLPAGTIIEQMNVYTNVGNVRLADSGGKILNLYASGEPYGGHDSSITEYKSMLDGMLTALNAALAANEYSDDQHGFKSALEFIGVSPQEILLSGAGIWLHLRLYNQSGEYSSLQAAQHALLFYTGSISV